MVVFITDCHQMLPLLWSVPFRKMRFPHSLGVEATHLRPDWVGLAKLDVKLIVIGPCQIRNVQHPGWEV